MFKFICTIVSILFREKSLRQWQCFILLLDYGKICSLIRLFFNIFFLCWRRKSVRSVLCSWIRPQFRSEKLKMLFIQCRNVHSVALGILNISVVRVQRKDGRCTYIDNFDGKISKRLENGRAVIISIEGFFFSSFD